jgi:hypothetical protein
MVCLFLQKKSSILSECPKSQEIPCRFLESIFPSKSFWECVFLDLKLGDVCSRTLERDKMKMSDFTGKFVSECE